MKKIILIFILLVLIFSCITVNDEEGVPLPPLRSTSSIRLEDIRNELQENPVSALNLIYTYKEVYAFQMEQENDEREQLGQLETEAVSNLVSLLEKAVEEERWEEALSFSRSLASISSDSGILEQDFYLADAMKKINEGNILGAFLSAVLYHEIEPLDMETAVLFLEKAVEVRQRRAAAFFLSAAEAAGGQNISSHLREYAQGRDTVSDMILGVATVIVDRGFRIERGRGIPDRVMGSAFFIDSTGLLVTNYHVISGMVEPRYRGSRMTIRMGDSASPRIPARVIGYDKALDLALIKAEIDTDYVFSLLDRATPKVGDVVLAIGSPLGLEKTVTSGIISAMGRRFLQIGDVIQIDAAINIGNSGGPVVDSEGRLVGVAFAGFVNQQGLSFIIPAERLAAALPAMMKGGKAQRPWLGLALCETFSGAEIIYTAPNTPASRHLVREGSIIQSINGKAITASQGALITALQDELFNLTPGELVSLVTIDSEGIVKNNVLMTVPRPEIPLLEAAKIDRRERIAAPLFGMLLVPTGGSFFSSNFSVRRVVLGSIADEAGISENDPISISRFRLLEEEGVALMDITVKKRRTGYLEANMQLPAWLDSPDTL